MSNFWKISSASAESTRNTYCVAEIIDAARKLLSEKYPHIVNDDVIAEVSYEGCGDSVSFSTISFSTYDDSENITINSHRICLNAADGVRYLLFEYENGIDDIFYCEQEDLKKEPIGETGNAKMKAKTQESMYKHLMCALGTMLPLDTVMSMSPEQIDNSAKKIAEYLLSEGYVKEGY